MSENIFEELAEWWNLSRNRDTPYEKALLASLLELGIMNKGETLISKRVIQEWEQDSEETYNSIVGFDFESKDRTRSVMVAGYAIVTPPGIPIEERAQIWRKRAENLSNNGVKIPTWYLVWKGTIYTFYPHFNIVEYTNNFKLEDLEISQIAQGLREIFKGLSKLSLIPLGLPYSLRTDSLSIYYCGMGFDIGESSGASSNDLIKTYEEDLLPHLPDSIKQAYNHISRTTSDNKE